MHMLKVIPRTKHLAISKIGGRLENLISSEYKRVLLETRQESQEQWGNTGHKYTVNVLDLLRKEEYKDVLDYGSGHGTLADSLVGYDVIQYDPGFPEKENNNVPRSFVTCVDVLEHIEPELLEGVLDDLQRCMLDKGYFVISCRKALKILSDGRNAHLIVEDKSWWREKLETRFDVLHEIWDPWDKLYSVHLKRK